MSRRKDRSAKGRAAPPDARPRPQLDAAVGVPLAQTKVGAGNAYTKAAVCGLLLLAVIAVFAQTANHDFVNCDDNDYVCLNRRVREGLTIKGTAWAFESHHAANWHPLTWLSHMLDCQFYDLKPGGHHLTNVLLHATTAIFLLLALQRMTRQSSAALWRSAWAAAVFAVHPLRVESVAWVAERKDVLSGLFFMLTLWFYARYTERPVSWARYLLVLASFALGLTAKPMLVTLPFVLLLLDYWPLARFGRVGRAWESLGDGTLRETVQDSDDRSQEFDSLRDPPFSRQFVPRTQQLRLFVPLIVEKIPMFVSAAASCAVTLVAQRSAMQSLEQSAFLWRVANAAVAYVAYLGKMLLPAELAVFYPLAQGPPPAWEVITAVIVLAAISTATFVVRRNCPYVFCGWLWYLGTLVPVIGLVQVGDQAMADRYTYLTQIGLYMALAWGAADLAGMWRYRRRFFASVSALLVGGLMACAWQHTAYWRNSVRLWTHALACTSPNATVQTGLGLALFDRGQTDEAIAHYRTALEINPGYNPAHDELGFALASRGQTDEAIDQYRKSLKIKPEDVRAHNNLALALAGRGQYDEAIAHYRQALEIKPDYVYGCYNLGRALASHGQVDEAIVCYRKVLEIDPNHVDAHNYLGTALAGRGKVDEAIVHFQKVLEIEPGNAEAYYNLGTTFADRRQIDQAIAYYRKALASDPDYVSAHYFLAKILADRGQVDEAIAHYRKVLQIVPDFVAAHINVGVALVGHGQVGEAIVHYRKVLQIEPDHVEAHNDLGVALAGREQVDEAIAAFSQGPGNQPRLPGGQQQSRGCLGQPRAGQRGDRMFSEGPRPGRRAKRHGPGRRHSRPNQDAPATGRPDRQCAMT